VASPWSGVLAVGCAAGVDAIGRAGFAPARQRVFRAAGSQGWQLAQRSAALVQALAGGGGCLVSFPSGACPAGLAPCPAWRSAGGSGSWGSLCLALGLGVPVFLFAPGGVAAPPAVAGRFAPVAACPGWFFAAAPPASPSLF
jgi:hypothetical protein